VQWLSRNRGGNPGEKEWDSAWEVGNESVGSGIPKGAGSGEKSHNTAQYFPIKKVQSSRSQQSRVRTGKDGNEKKEA